jgi:hypothetical protein
MSEGELEIAARTVNTQAEAELSGCNVSFPRLRTCRRLGLAPQCANTGREQMQQNLLMMLQCRLFRVGRIGSHHFLRSVNNPR